MSDVGKTRPEADVTLTFRLDGQDRVVTVPANTMLSQLLRERFDRTGVKLSCERGVCGACTCLVDGDPVATCGTFAFDADGTEVETVHGLAETGELSPPQQGFAQRSGFQCGYCTSGMLMMSVALLREHPNPDEATAREWLSSNTCRCTGYRMILDSVARAAALTDARGNATQEGDGDA